MYWITRVIESKSETYGAIGAALGILFWAYLLGRILAGAAILNAGRVAAAARAPPAATARVTALVASG